MEELKSVVLRAQSGDLDSYGELVRRFQDMAYGYAYSILGDFHLAEDAAQEAFIQAYRNLESLQQPIAFPGWFRTIVFKHCDRLTRRRRVSQAPLEVASGIESNSEIKYAVAPVSSSAEIFSDTVNESVVASPLLITIARFVGGVVSAVSAFVASGSSGDPQLVNMTDKITNNDNISLMIKLIIRECFDLRFANDRNF